MRLTVFIVVLLLMQSALHAGWSALKVGDAPERVAAEVGKPLFVNKSRGIEVWIYDRGGTVEFQGSRVTYLQASQPEPKTPAPAVSTAPAAPAARH